MYTPGEQALQVRHQNEQAALQQQQHNEVSALQTGTEISRWFVPNSLCAQCDTSVLRCALERARPLVSTLSQ